MGAELSGKFSGDGLYDVIVEEATDSGYGVLFPGARSARTSAGAPAARPTASDEFRYYDEEGGYYDEAGHYYDAEGNQYVVTETRRRPRAERMKVEELAPRGRSPRRRATRWATSSRRATTSRSATCCSANSVRWPVPQRVVEEVTETGYKVLFTEHEGEDGDREELPREHLRYYYADEGSDDDDRATPSRRATTSRSAITCSAKVTASTTTLLSKR